MEVKLWSATYCRRCPEFPVSHLQNRENFPKGSIVLLRFFAVSIVYTKNHIFRAFFNGKLDLTSAEGLADLLNAETSAQRKLALRQASGDLKKLYDDWRQRFIKVSLQSTLKMKKYRSLSLSIFQTWYSVLHISKPTLILAKTTKSKMIQSSLVRYETLFHLLILYIRAKIYFTALIFRN